MTDFSASADLINAASQDPIPKLAAPPDTHVSLLHGFDGEDKDAVVRELTGADEEFLAGLEAKTGLTYPEYLSALLKRAVVSIGSWDIKKFPDLVDELIIADRDILFLAIIKATYGQEKKFRITCPHCKEVGDISIDIDEHFKHEGSYEEAIASLTVTLRDGSEITLRIPTGADTRYVTKRGKTVPEQNTLMIARCADIEVADKEEWARSLNIGDRNALRDALLNVKIGPKAGEVNDPCPYCGEIISLPLDWVSLLFG